MSVETWAILMLMSAFLSWAALFLNRHEDLPN